MARFVHDVWTLAARNGGAPPTAGPPGAGSAPSPGSGADGEKTLRQAVHQTLKKVTEDYGQFKYNTLLAALMSLRNQMKAGRDALEGGAAWEEALDTLVLMLAPVMPFITEELWQARHPGPSVHLQAWPKYDPALATAETVTLIVQVNGKVRDRVEIPADTAPERLHALALGQAKVQEALAGMTVRKVIPVGNKLVNIVAGR
jgi:leucyl-tRNA synthetase